MKKFSIILALFFLLIISLILLLITTQKAPLPERKPSPVSEKPAETKKPLTPSEATLTTPPIAPPTVKEAETPTLPLPNKEELLSEITMANTSRKQVVFTFDAGAQSISVDSILKSLKKHELKGTFFVTGNYARKNPELVRKIAQEGHEIFNHTDRHLNLTKISEASIIAELENAEKAISNLTGKTTKPYFRPPYGARDKRVREIAANLGYQCVYWTVDALDWKEGQGITDSDAKKRILENIRPGTIILMHVGDGITGRILYEVIEEIKRKGYMINPLSASL